MTYVKPQLASIADALTAIQQVPLVKASDTHNDQRGDTNKKTISAYEGDE